MLGGCVIHQGVDEDLLWGRHKITKAMPRTLAIAAVSVVLLMEQDRICAVGRLKCNAMRTTFDKVVSIDLISYEYGWVRMEDLLTVIPPRFRVHVRNGLSKNGMLRPATWAAVRQAIGLLEPNMGEHIGDIEQKTYSGPRRTRDFRFSIPAFEKDAVNLAAQFAGVSRRVLDGLVASREPVPFLVGLQSPRVIEDQIIYHDLNVFGDWNLFNVDALGTTRFTDGKHWVSVTNVNRTRVELTVGVDLIYYNHKYAAYVLVQYKRFTRQSDNGHGTRWVYRPRSDRNFQREIQRMTLVHNLDTASPSTPNEFRLNCGPCFVKFCEPDINLATAELSKGMYQSLDYLKLLLQSPSLNGPRGGTAITYDTVQRHLTNSEFVALVQKGWVGSTGLTTSRITQYIQEALNAKRSVILAVSGTATDRDSREVSIKG